MELLKDFDCIILYHPGKPNVMGDALSRKSMGSLAHIAEIRRPLIYEFHELEASGISLGISEQGALLAHFQAWSSLVDKVKEAQGKDPNLEELKHVVLEGKKPRFFIDNSGVMIFERRICVPNIEALKKEILEEAHKFAYSVHPKATKMYQDLKQTFWWEGMKKDIVCYVSRFLTCQQVKVEHWRPGGLFQ